MEISNKTYIIFEDIKEEEAPSGFKLDKAKYGEWKWEINVYKDEEGKYTLVCMQDKESGEKVFFTYDEEKGTFGSSIAVSVAEFMEYKDLAAEASEKGKEKNSMAPMIALGAWGVAGTAAAIWQFVRARKREYDLY